MNERQLARFLATGPFTIYALRDARTKSIRYVGRAADANVRKKQHRGASGSTSRGLNRWLSNRRAELIPLVKVRGFDRAVSQEAYWVRRLRAKGAKLLNQRTSIGGGAPFRLSPARALALVARWRQGWV